MGVAALIGSSSALLLIAFGLALGLTYVPCYSSLCVEQFYPYHIRVYIAVCYATLVSGLFVLLCRKYSTRLERAFASLVFNRPIPYTSTHLSWGASTAFLGILFLFAFGHGYLFESQYDFYKARTAAATNDISGAVQLAVVGITGHFNDSLIGLLLLPVSRDGVLTRFFRLQVGTLLRLHKLTAYLLVVSVVVHTVLFIAWIPVWAKGSTAFKEAFSFNNPTVSSPEGRNYPYYNVCLGTGVAAALVFIIILISSLPMIRRANYNTFYYLHSLSILFLILVCLHASTNFYLLIPGLSLWIYDWIFRAKSLSVGVTAQIQKDENGWYRIIVPGLAIPAHVSRRELETLDLPLKTYYINVPAVAKVENHPFTTCSGSLFTPRNVEHQDLVFLWRVPTTGKPEKDQRKEWTSKLASLLDDLERQENVDLEIGNNLAEDKVVRTTARQLPARTIKLRLEGPYTTPIAPFEQYRSVICVVGGTGISGALSLVNTYIARKSVKRPCVTRRFRIVWSVRDTEDADIFDVSDMLALAAERNIVVVFEKHLTGVGRQRLNFAGALQPQVSESESTWVYLSGPGGFMSTGEQTCIDINTQKDKWKSGTRSNPAGLDYYCAKWDV